MLWSISLKELQKQKHIMFLLPRSPFCVGLKIGCAWNLCRVFQEENWFTVATCSRKEETWWYQSWMGLYCKRHFFLNAQIQPQNLVISLKNKFSPTSQPLVGSSVDGHSVQQVWRKLLPYPHFDVDGHCASVYQVWLPFVASFIPLYSGRNTYGVFA